MASVSSARSINCGGKYDQEVFLHAEHCIGACVRYGKEGVGLQFGWKVGEVVDVCGEGKERVTLWLEDGDVDDGCGGGKERVTLWLEGGESLTCVLVGSRG